MMMKMMMETTERMMAKMTRKMVKVKVKATTRMKAKTTKKMVKVKVKATARMKAKMTRMKAKTTRKMVKVKATVAIKEVMKVGMSLSPVTAYVMQMTSLAGLDVTSASTASLEMVNVKIKCHLNQ